MQDDEPLIDVESAGFPVMLVVVVVVLAGVSILVYRTYCRKSFTGARATLCCWLRSRILRFSLSGAGCAQSLSRAQRRATVPPSPPPPFPFRPRRCRCLSQPGSLSAGVDFKDSVDLHQPNFSGVQAASRQPTIPEAPSAP